MNLRATIVATQLVIACAASAVGQAPPSEAPETVAAPSWEETNRQLERIADLLERHLEGRKIELLTRRVEITAARLAPLQEELARARSSRGDLVRERVELEDRIESTSEEMTSGALEISQEEFERFVADLERRLTTILSAVRDLDDRIAELEGEILRYETEVDEWQAYLDRELTGL